MPNNASAPGSTRPGDLLFGFLFLAGLAIAFFGAALVLGTEPRLFIERTAPGEFRATGSNYFSGIRFFSKTAERVSGPKIGSAFRDRRSDSIEEVRRQRRTLHLALYGEDGTRIGWDRERDAMEIERFMRGSEPSLVLVMRPPLWRMALAWFCAVMGCLTFLGAIQNTFGKPRGVSGLP